MNLKKLLITALLIAAVMGCSRGGSDPVGGSVESPSGNPFSLDSIPVVGFDNTSAIGMMGAYNLTIDPENADAELVPVRTSQIGESYIVSGKSFFATQPCVDCLRIERVTMTPDGDVALGFWIKHPFPAGNPAEPPSGKNRLDLDLFDVACVVQPTDKTPANYSLLQANVYNDAVINTDGYTTELAGVTGDDSALPYVICYKRQSKNRFRMGVPDEYFYVVFSKTGMSFNLFLTFGYGASASFLDRLEPTYYIPEFNRKSAWRVEVEGSTWYGQDPAEITIDIYDWNHGAVVAPDFPDPTHPHYISAPSDISSVSVEVPGMTDSVIAAVTTDTRTDGWDDPITYTATFTNENSIPQGDYIGIVKVVDSRPPGDSLAGDSLIDSPDGRNLIVHAINEFATYQTFTATIAPPCGPITGEVLSPDCPVTGVLDDALLDFTVTASSDNSGDPIVLYEVDWDYDGVTFDVDAESTDGVFTELGPFVNPNCPDTTPEIYTVAFRATDSCYHPNTTIFATCEVQVDICCGPITGQVDSPTCPVSGVANNGTIDFVVSAASDNGGDPVVLYDADYDYDGITFDVDDSNSDGIFNDGGPFRNPNCPGSGEPAILTVAFRATDSCDPPNTTIIDTCEVTVDICAGWTLSWGGVGNDQGVKVRTDSANDIYVTGLFSDTVDLDPGTGVNEFTSNGGTDIFLSKFSSLGVYQWSIAWGGEGDDVPRGGMYIDSSDKIYIAGLYTGTCDFDPGPGDVTYTSNNDTADVFYSVFDSDGNLQHARAWGGESSITGDSACSIVTSSTGDIYVGGYYEGTADFDTGMGTDSRTSAALADMFISKFNSAGEYQWAITLGAWGYDEVRGLMVDSGGNILAAGGFFAAFDFDPGTGTDQHTSQGEYDIFLAKYDTDGNYVWAESMGGSVDDRAWAIYPGASDSIYMTGHYMETVDFDPDPVGVAEFSSNGGKDIFISHFNSDGTHDFTEVWGGESNDQAFDLVIKGDEMLIAGTFEDLNVDFDPGAETDTYSSNGSSDAFVSKFTVATFDYVEARTWGGDANDMAFSAMFDESDNYLVTGYFSDVVDFDPSQYEDNRESAGEGDVYLSNLVR